MSAQSHVCIGAYSKKILKKLSLSVSYFLSLFLGDLLTALCAHCRDPSIAVRKQMVISLSGMKRCFPVTFRAL
jgi:hypothetical protein